MAPFVRRRVVLRALPLAPLAAVAACRDGSDPAPSPSPPPPSPSTASSGGSAEPAPSPTAASPTPADAGHPVGPLEIEAEVADGLAVPWGITFLRTRRAFLVGQRDSAEVVRIGLRGGLTRVGTVAGVASNARFGGEGGLLGLAIDPAEEWLYAYCTTEQDNRVVRIPWPAWGEPEVVLDGIPTALHHNGGALLFDSAGLLYVATGDAEDAEAAQDTGSLAGKVLRITPTGGVPPGNPFDNHVWSYGHRNVEGLALDEQGRLWASEFGEKEADELNLIEPGQDYGWPGVEGSDGPGGGRDPLAQWPTDRSSPAGVAISAGHAWLGALQGECVWSVDLATGRTRRHLTGHGRIRMVASPELGVLYVGTSNRDGRGDARAGDDRIWRCHVGGVPE